MKIKNNISKSTYQAITPRACRPSIRKFLKVPNEKRNPWEREFSGRSCFPGLIWIDYVVCPYQHKYIKTKQKHAQLLHDQLLFRYNWDQSREVHHKETFSLIIGSHRGSQNTFFFRLAYRPNQIYLKWSKGTNTTSSKPDRDSSLQTHSTNYIVQRKPKSQGGDKQTVNQS